MTKRPLLQPSRQQQLPAEQLSTALTGKPIAPALIAITSVMIAMGITVPNFGLEPLGPFIAHAMNAHQPRFDHHQFDQLLDEHVDEDGYVDYAKLQEHPGLLLSLIHI